MQQRSYLLRRRLVKNEITENLLSLSSGIVKFDKNWCSQNKFQHAQRNILSEDFYQMFQKLKISLSVWGKAFHKEISY